MKDLTEILKTINIGTKFYDIIHSEVIFQGISNSDIYPIVCKDLYNLQLTYTKEGKLNTADKECALFPSKENKNWNDFFKDLPLLTPCVCFDELLLKNSSSGITVRYYAGNGTAFSNGNQFGTGVKWNYVIPCGDNKFNFNNNTFEEKDNYGLLGPYFNR